MLADQPAGVPLTRIRQFIAAPGIWQTTPDGQRCPMAARGFEHRLE
ncbi:MAG: hypothetical protein ACYC35_16895 [Pirellulales bacterium]